jgi:transcriptional regulator with XRE-family HTH domain
MSGRGIVKLAGNIKPWCLIFCERGVPKRSITSEQVRAARALLRWEQKDLSRESGVSHATIRRLETIPGPLAAHASTLEKIRAAFERGGVVFIDENGGGAGLRYKAKQLPP